MTPAPRASWLTAAGTLGSGTDLPRRPADAPGPPVSPRPVAASMSQSFNHRPAGTPLCRRAQSPLGYRR
jgi:hypothetical protein